MKRLARAPRTRQSRMCLGEEAEVYVSFRVQQYAGFGFLSVQG